MSNSTLERVIEEVRSLTADERRQLIELMEKEASHSQANYESQSWAANFFEETYGCLKEDPIAREPQGEFEERAGLE